MLLLRTTNEKKKTNAIPLKYKLESNIFFEHKSTDLFDTGENVSVRHCNPY